MSDIYNSPRAELVDFESGDESVSIESALAGEYEFEIKDVFSEAWQLTKGAKWTFHLALGLYTLVYIFISVAISYGLVSLIDPGESAAVISVIIQVVAELAVLALTTPLMAGLMLLGLRRAVNAEINAGLVMSCFDKIVPLFLTSLIMGILIVIGIICLVIPGIYLAFAYFFATLLVVDRDMQPWEALETSRKALGHRWFTFFGYSMLLFLVMLVSVIPLGIGLIWTVPFSMIGYGVIYRNIFGCSAASKQR